MVKQANWLTRCGAGMILKLNLVYTYVLHARSDYINNVVITFFEQRLRTESEYSF